MSEIKREKKERKKNMRLLLFVISIACLHFGCNVYKPVTNLPEEDIVGTWILTDESKLFLKKKEWCCVETPTELTISENHTFHLRNIQDCWVVSSRECKGTLNLKGQWRLYKDSTFPDSTFDLFLNDGETTRVVFIGKNKTEYALLFGFGDPDSGNSILLRKVK